MLALVDAICLRILAAFKFTFFGPVGLGSTPALCSPSGATSNSATLANSASSLSSSNVPASASS